MIVVLAHVALGAEVDGHAELRLIETMPDTFPIDADGGTWGWGPVVDSRLRLGAAARAGEQLRIDVEADAIAGQLAGETWSLSPLDERDRHTRDAFTSDGLVARKALVGTRLPWFDLEVGLTTSAWGLGMVANDGGTDPWFGRSDFGDRTLRARIATAPFARGEERLPLYVILAGDRVVADDLARWSEGDEAYQGVAALLYTDDRKLVAGTAPRRLGVYGVVRDQDGPHGHTRAHVIDGYADWGFAPARTVIRVAAEGAVVLGRTDVASTYVADELPVRQGGLAVQTSVARGAWTVRLDGVVASGDAASDDGRVTDFRFDRDYAVGMVLFEELIAAIDLAALAQATDPTLAAYPPEGVDTLAAEGAVHGAAALQPAVSVAPLPWVELRGGVVLAWSTAPIAQPFETFRAGGAPTNHVGEPTSGRYLGTELDWAVATRAPDDWRVRPAFALMGGHALPSDDLSGVVRSVDHLLLVARVAL